MEAAPTRPARDDGPLPQNRPDEPHHVRHHARFRRLGLRPALAQIGKRETARGRPERSLATSYHGPPDDLQQAATASSRARAIGSIDGTDGVVITSDVTITVAANDNAA